MSKVLLSLEPLAEALACVEPQTGAKFMIAALSGERDAELQRECSDLMGNVNVQLHAAKVCQEVLKGWTGVGKKGAGELPCNKETIATFAKWHGQGLALWVVRRSRSIAHYVEEEVEQAKNV